MGDRFTHKAAADLLNDMRASLAHKQVIALGGSPEEAEQAATASQLTPRAISYQIKQATEHAQRAARMGMAMLLDTQVAEVQGELEDSYRASDSIWDDIVLSRKVTQRSTRGKFRDEDGRRRVNENGQEALRIIGQAGLADREEGQRLIELIGVTMSAPQVEPADMVTVVRENAAQAALYTRLVGERSERRKLRAEIRSLFYGREVFEDQSRRRESLLQAVTDADSPDQAHSLAVRSIEDEMNSLVAAQEVSLAPWTPDMISVQRGRTADLLQRMRAVKEFQELSATGSDAKGFTFRIVELDAATQEDHPTDVLVERE